MSGHPRGGYTSPACVYALVLYIGNAQTTFPQCTGSLTKAKNKNPRDAAFVRPPTGSLHKSYVRVCTCIVHWQCANNTKTTFPQCTGSLKKAKNKNPRDANFVRPPKGSLHKSYVRVCTCIVHWQCANNTKTTFPQCTGSLTKAKNKNPRDADFVRPPTGSLHKSYVRVCTCIVHWQCANNTKTTFPQCTGSLTKAKNKNPRDADFVRPPTGSLHKSYVRVCTCIVHWQCANTKTTFPQCTGSLTKAKKKIRATRILSGHPRGRYTSPTCVYALVLYIGNAQTTFPQCMGSLTKAKNKNPRDAAFVRPPTGSLHKSYVRVCTCIVHWQCANNTKTTFPQCTGSLKKAKNKNPRDANLVRPPTGSLHKSYVRVCTCIVHWQCANNTKTTFPQCTGSLTKAKNKNPRDADFVRPPTGSSHKSYVRVCTCIVHWQCANNTKTTFPQCTGSLTKAKNKNPRDADFVRPPTGSLHKSYVRVCTCIVHWQCANNTKAMFSTQNFFELKV